MRLGRLPFFLLVLLLLSNGGGAQDTADLVPGKLMLRLEKGTDPRSVEEDLAELQGSETGLEAGRKLSHYLNVRLFRYDTGKVDGPFLLERLRSHEAVRSAQFEHRMERRATPNDPLFTQPEIWPYINDGSNGGVADADIDADLAWDITTGGTSIHGDTIVVAVIDGGFQLDHEDLDFFRNHAEANGSNGVDDDGNGYVDDVQGWDAYDSDGTIPGDDHGTHVAGTVGAIGDNGVGWTGVNWNVEVLPVAGSSTNESTVVAAYDYVLRMRALYDSTNGQKGAFVVATNSSFGVNKGDPANHPIWCAMYDTLGAYGITNAVAGPNRDIDIDSKGDVPGTCPSPHTICVTNTKNDDSRADAGYGDVNVDLGAPGTGIHSTLPGDSYGNKDGTSMASPHVAGAIALLYSVDCPDLMALLEARPDSASRLVKEAIMKGVDTTSAMTGMTVSDGRLNIHKALLHLDSLGYCDTNTSCFAPYLLDAKDLTDSSATLTYETFDKMDSVELRYKASKDSNWTLVKPDSTGPFSIDSGLSGCTGYEFQVRGFCGSDSSKWSFPYRFETLDCCEPPTGFGVSSKSKGKVRLEWKERYAAAHYELRYRADTTDTWTDLGEVQGTDTTIRDLGDCRVHEAELRTDCDTGNSAYSSTLSFSTPCPSCDTSAYCSSKGQNADYEWIDRVELAGLDKRSGNDGGYLYHPGANATLLADSSYVFTLTPGFDNSLCPCTEYFRIWIDLDRDQSFETPEELLYESSGVDAPLTDTLHIPDTLDPGGTRMRVSMRYNSLPSACSDVDNGEVEDHCVRLRKGEMTGLKNRSEAEEEVRLFPNPARRSVELQLGHPPSRGSYFVLYDGLGRTMMERSVTQRRELFNIEGLAPGTYFYRVIGERASGSGKLIIEDR